MRCYQRHIDFSFVGFLPSVPLLFPTSCRKVAPSTTGDLGERCKDPSESWPTTHSEWVHLIQFNSQSTAGSEPLRPPAANNFWTFYMQFYLCFSALWKQTINDDRKDIIGLRSHVMLHAQISNF